MVDYFTTGKGSVFRDFTPENGLVFVILLGKGSVFHDFTAGKGLLFITFTPATEGFKPSGPASPYIFGQSAPPPPPGREQDAKSLPKIGDLNFKLY